MSQPWLNDACSLVDAFRAGEITPTEALEASLDAIARRSSTRSRSSMRTPPGSARRTPTCRNRSAACPIGIKELEPVEAGRTPRRRSSSRTASRRTPPRGSDACSPRAATRSDSARRSRVRRAERQQDEAQRHHRQRLEPVAHRGRLVRRQLGGGLRRARPDRVRRRRRRFDPHPGRVQRTARHEGHGRTDPAGAEHVDRTDDRRPRVPGALRARRRALVRRLRRLRRARSVQPPEDRGLGSATSGRASLKGLRVVISPNLGSAVVRAEVAKRRRRSRRSARERRRPRDRRRPRRDARARASSGPSPTSSVSTRTSKDCGPTARTTSPTRWPSG